MHLLLKCWDSDRYPGLLWRLDGTEMLFQTGSQENGERAFLGRRIFRKSWNLVEGAACNSNPVEQDSVSFSGQMTGTSHGLRDWWCPPCQGCSKKSPGLWDWAFGCVCSSPWLDFVLPLTPYSSFSLYLVICSYCSIGATFMLLRRSLRSCYLSALGQICPVDWVLHLKYAHAWMAKLCVCVRFCYFSINGCVIPSISISKLQLNQQPR